MVTRDSEAAKESHPGIVAQGRGKLALRPDLVQIDDEPRLSGMDKMDMDNMKEQVKQIFLQVFDELKPEEFSFDKKQPDYERWDSFAHMQLISEIENKMGITFDMEEVVGIESATDIVKLIEEAIEG